MNEIQEIKSKVGQAAKDIIISQLGLERIGTKYRCPNRMAHRHGDRSPSMAWDDNLMQFKCFGCGKLIDIYSLYREYLNYSHVEVVRELLGNNAVGGGMMELEKQIFSDVFNFLRSNFEVKKDPEYWAEVVKQQTEIERKYPDDPLARNLLKACTDRLCARYDKEVW